jgi:hypothetical protein
VLLAQVLQAGIKRVDLGFEEAILMEKAIQQKPVMIANAATQRQLELRDLAPQLTR